MTALIRPQHTELILPAAKTRAAKAINERIDYALSLLPTNAQRQQFASSIIIEANGLDGCTDISVMKAALNAAKVGLPVGGPLGLSYFVPFKGECTLIIGYRGFIDLAFQGGFLKDVYADVVLRGEHFRQWTDEKGAHFEHEPQDPFERDADRTNIVGAYCVYQNRKGGHGFKFVSRKKIDKADKGERTANGKPTPWGTNYDEMCMKTAVRRAAKGWQLTPQLALAVQLDEEAEREVPQSIDPQLLANTPKAISFDDYEEPGHDSEPKGDTPDMDAILEALNNCKTPSQVKEIENYWEGNADVASLCKSRLDLMTVQKKKSGTLLGDDDTTYER